MKPDQSFFLFFFQRAREKEKLKKKRNIYMNARSRKKKKVSDPRECEFQPITTAPFHFIGAGVPWVWSIFFLLQDIFSG